MANPDLRQRYVVFSAWQAMTAHWFVIFSTVARPLDKLLFLLSGKKQQNADALYRCGKSRQMSSASVPLRTVEELACSSLQIGADEAQVDDVRRAYQADPDSSDIDFETDQSASESGDEAPPASQSTKVTSRGGLAPVVEC